MPSKEGYRTNHSMGCLSCLSRLAQTVCANLLCVRFCAGDEQSILDKPSRIQRALDAANRVKTLGNLEMVQLTEVDARKDIYEYARLAHTNKYVTRQLAALDKAERVGKPQTASVISASSHRKTGGDTLAAPGTRQAVESSLSCVLRGVDAVMKGEYLHPFCCVRPPGHHVGRDGRTHDASSQGFCFFNNVAIAAKYAVDHLGLNRVAVIDFDVHHGNGTEEILSSDSRFFFVSTHVRGQDDRPFYPGTGHEEDSQLRQVINVDLSLGFELVDLISGMVEEHVETRLAAFQPELIILSSGFDAHKDDPSHGAQLTTKDFYELTQRFIRLAWNIESCHGRLLSVLEGGYNVELAGGLQSSIEAHLRALSRKEAPPSSKTAAGSKRRIDHE